MASLIHERSLFLSALALQVNLKSFYSLLQKNGVVLISTPNLYGKAHRSKGDSWLAFTDLTHINIKTDTEWSKIFEKEGFEIAENFSDGFYDFPYGNPFHPRNLIFAALTVFNLFSRRPNLGPNFGENSVFILKKHSIMIKP
jgi:hypothetical protein